MKRTRKLKWFHVWDNNGVVHVSIQRGNRHRTYYAPSRRLVKWLSNVAFNLYGEECGKFAPSTVGLGWSWRRK